MSIQKLSEFGKLVRIARLHEGKSLKQMADFSGVSSAYLSAVETGRKEITEKTIELIAQFLAYDGEQKDQLYAAANRSNGKVQINVEDLNEDGIEAMTLFARYKSSFSPEALKRISDSIKDEVANRDSKN